MKKHLLFAIIVAVFFLPDLSHAVLPSDEFTPIYDKLEQWRTGGLGRSILIASLIGVAVGTLFSMRIVLMPAIAIALILGFGKDIFEPLIAPGVSF